MTNRRKVTVTVHTWEEGFNCHPFEFINQLAALLDSIPEQHRNTAEFEFDRYGGDYNYSAGELNLSYSRMETDEELEKRWEWERASKTEAANRERAIYEQLKQKFG